MKHRIIAGTWGLLVLVSVGNRFQLDVDTGMKPSEEGVREERIGYWLGGMAGPGVPSLWARCGYGVAQIDTRITAEDLAATALTAGLYAPRTVAVTCAAGPSAPPELPARPGVTDTVQAPEVVGAWTAYANVGTPWWLGEDGEVAVSGPASRSVLVRNDRTLGDGWVEAVVSQVDEGGLVLRFRDPGSYYLLALRDDDAPWPRGAENLALYKCVGGELLELWKTDVDWPGGYARRVRFAAAGDRLSVFLDGALVASVVDERPLPAGGFGVRHDGLGHQSLSHFKSITWGGR